VPRTPAQAIGFLLGFGLALWLWPGTVAVARADAGAFAELEARLWQDVNVERARHHLIPLERRADLDRVARAHSEDMARRRYFAHESPDGRDPLDRIGAVAAPGFTLAAENVGTTNRSNPNREILQSWLASPVHRRNLLAPPFNATGVGIARAPDGSLLYTQVYVTYPR
jgi:uncharacterized protein YkwD